MFRVRCGGLLQKLTVSALNLIFIVCATVTFSQPVKVEQLAKTTRSWNGVSLPDYSDKETEITVLRITIAPHTKLPMHYHPVINVGYMLEGELTVISEQGVEKVIAKGDCLVELVGQNHYGENRSDKPARILVIYVGEENQPITVKYE